MLKHLQKALVQDIVGFVGVGHVAHTHAFGVAIKLPKQRSLRLRIVGLARLDNTEQVAIGKGRSSAEEQDTEAFKTLIQVVK